MSAAAIDIELSRLAIGFSKVCIIRLPQCTNITLNFVVAYSTSSGSVLFKQYFHKPCKTFQLNNQSALFAKTY